MDILLRAPLMSNFLFEAECRFGVSVDSTWSNSNLLGMGRMAEPCALILCRMGAVTFTEPPVTPLFGPGGSQFLQP